MEIYVHMKVIPRARPFEKVGPWPSSLLPHLQMGEATQGKSEDWHNRVSNDWTTCSFFSLISVIPCDLGQPAQPHQAIAELQGHDAHWGHVYSFLCLPL